MQAIFYIGGPKVKHASPGAVVQADVAPTIAKLLGINPAVGYEGAVVPVLK